MPPQATRAGSTRISTFRGHLVHRFRGMPLISPARANRARRELREKGLTRLEAHAFDLDAMDGKDLPALIGSFDELRRDPYDPKGTRFRAHAELSLEVNGENPIFVAGPSAYRQTTELNPGEEGKVRTFDALPESAWHRFTWRLMDGLIRCLPDDSAARSHRVQIHQISYRATLGTPSVSSPIGLHRDGEPYTAVVLMRTEDLRGGQSVVTSLDERDCLLAHTLMQPLEVLIINDVLVKHQVTPVELGRRDVLLIDFTPKVCA